MLCHITSATLAAYNQLLPRSVSLITSQPRSGRWYPQTSQKKRSIKCATTWQLRSTATDPVRYGAVNIPPPFEPNQDPLLTGVANTDLNWTADQVDYCVKAAAPHPDVIELIALQEPFPYGNLMDTEAGKNGLRGRYRADWFQDREPVMLKEVQGKGYWLINQMLTRNGGLKSTIVMNQILTTLGASIGQYDNYYNVDYSLLPPSGPKLPPVRVLPNAKAPLLAQPGSAVFRVNGRYITLPFEFTRSACAVQVYNALGRRVRQLEVNTWSASRLDLRRDLGLPEGLYVVRIERLKGK
jgi:hypothetical protein